MDPRRGHGRRQGTSVCLLALDIAAFFAAKVAFQRENILVRRR